MCKKRERERESTRKNNPQDIVPNVIKWHCQSQSRVLLLLQHQWLFRAWVNYAQPLPIFTRCFSEMLKPQALPAPPQHMEVS